MTRPGSGLRRAAAVAAAGLGVLAGGCGGVRVRRDLSELPPAQVIYDDMCRLQGYFDAIDGKKGDAPRVVSDTSMEKDVGKRAAGGRSVFAFEGPFQLTALRRVLDENWRELPPALGSARRVEVEVRWSEKAGVQRAVTTDAAVMNVGGKSVDLPYHHCLSDFLFGASLYRTRRHLVGLAVAVPPPLPSPPAPPAAPPPDPPVNTADGTPPATPAPPTAP